MNGRRILILTSAHLCRNPRVVKEATTLGTAGYDVTVLSVSVHPQFEQTDRELIRSLPFKRLTIDYTVDAIPARIASFCDRGATWVARQLCRRFGFETAQTLGPASALLRQARSLPADLTIVHTEIPLWCAPYLIESGRRVAVDMEDWYSEDLLPADRQSRPLHLLRAAEAFALQRAAYVSTPSKCMADALAGRYGGKRPLVLHNAFPLQERTAADRAASTNPPSLVWFSQTVGPGRGLESFLPAWANTTQPSKVCLLGKVRADYRTQLLDSIPPARQPDLIFLPPVAPHELPAKLVEFDLGLALEESTPANRDFALTNKILQYLNAGLAVIATGTAGQREVMETAPDSGLLISLQNPEQLTAQLDALLGDHARLRHMQAAARAAAEEYFCWEKDAPKLLAAVAEALARPSPSKP